MEILIPAVILTQRRKDAEYAEIFGRVALVATVGNLMDVFKHGGQENKEILSSSCPPVLHAKKALRTLRLCVKNKTTSH